MVRKPLDSLLTMKIMRPKKVTGAGAGGQCQVVAGDWGLVRSVGGADCQREDEGGSVGEGEGGFSGCCAVCLP